MPRHHSKGISPVLATIIIVAVTVAIAIAVAGWLIGLWNTETSQEVYFNYHIVLETPNDTATVPIPGYAKIEAWSEPAGNNQYVVHLRITALKKLAYIQAEAIIKNQTGEPPIFVGEQYSHIEWEDTNIPAGYYSERDWQPIVDQDYPLQIEVKLFLK